MRDPTPQVDCKYGAPMGRVSIVTDCDGKVSLRRVPLNSGGYDRGGAYWGHPNDLYWVGDESGGLDMFIRAKSRAAAKAAVLADWPGAKFYR